ncbi:MAG: hypothetical protein LBD67_02185 [Candidatus Accumulibacter sp.]|nr:hypothetical protein [Accumulibacter sp.]
MRDSCLLLDFVAYSTKHFPENIALTHCKEVTTYAAFQDAVCVLLAESRALACFAASAWFCSTISCRATIRLR